MPRQPVDVDTLLAVVDDPQSVEDLAWYFEPDPRPHHPGSRFESLAGGGDRPEVANTITADDLVAVSLLGAGVPGDVALAVLEGDLGPDISRHLAEISTGVGIGDLAAADLLGTSGSAAVAHDLLAEPPGMSQDAASTLLARKRPRLLPVNDRVVRCAYGSPPELEHWLLTVFADSRLDRRLLAARDRAGVSPHVSALRVLHVVVWMRHAPAHLEHHCPGPRW
jgi:hypothetical protein